MTKILLCHDFYAHPGGESEVFEAELRGLRQFGHEVIVYKRENQEIATFPPAGRIAMVFSAYHSRRTDRELRHLVRLHKPDVAIVQNVFPLLSPSVYTALAAEGVPVIQAVYNYRFICPSGELFTEGAICERCVGGSMVHAAVHKCYRGSLLQSAWYASILGWHRSRGTFTRNITSLMVPDRFMASKLEQGGIPAEKIWCNANPFFVDDYRPSNSHKSFVLYVGRLETHKGIFTLLDAMRETDKPLRLVLVGQGSMAEQIGAQTLLPELTERVTLLGPNWGNGLSELLRDCLAVVIPSEWYDNLPQILCQANAAGKPVVASNLNGLPEYVRGAVNGFLFEPGNASELGERISQIARLSPTEYGRLAQQARLFAEDHFDYRHHYLKLAGVLAELANRVHS